MWYFIISISKLNKEVVKMRKNFLRDLREDLEILFAGTWEGLRHPGVLDITLAILGLIAVIGLVWLG